MQVKIEDRFIIEDSTQNKIELNENDAEILYEILKGRLGIVTSLEEAVSGVYIDRSKYSQFNAMGGFVNEEVIHTHVNPKSVIVYLEEK